MKFSISRDIAFDIRRVIDEEIEASGPTWTAGSVALRVVDRLRNNDPELLNKWLEMSAVNAVRLEIVSVTRALRAEAKRNTERRTEAIFGKAVDKFEAGEKEGLGAWLETIYIVNNDNHRRRLQEMDHDELIFAAEDYTNRSRTNAMQAAFLRAIAERVGARTVGEVFSDEDLSRLWRSLL